MTAAMQISSADARATFALAGEFAASEDAGAIRDGLFSLPGLIGADGLLDVRIAHPPGGELQIRADVSDPSVYAPAIVVAVTRWWHLHPIVARHVQRRTPEPIMVSDFLTGAQWRRNVVFNEGYRPSGIVHDLSVQFSWTREGTVCAALHRSSTDFGERERTILTQLTPHVRAAHARVAAREGRERRIELLEQGIEADGSGLLLAGPDGRIRLAGARARRILRDWFGAPVEATRIPAELAEWRTRAGAAADPAPLRRARRGRRLRIQLVTGAGEDLFVLREERDETPSAEALAAALPISRREADVLAHVVDGHTNAAIAGLLGLSPRTVGHHLERVYAKLAVSNRAAATAAALAALNGPLS